MSELASDTAAAGEAPEQRLRQTIDLIGEDVALIELWAVALSSFAQPAPHYDFGKPSERDGRRS